MNNQKVVKKVTDDLYTDTDATVRDSAITVVPDPLTADADDDFKLYNYYNIMNKLEDSVNEILGA